MLLEVACYVLQQGDVFDGAPWGNGALLRQRTQEEELFHRYYNNKIFFCKSRRVLGEDKVPSPPVLGAYSILYGIEAAQ